VITRGFGVWNQRRWTNEKHCDEKLRDETLSWWSSTINPWKQNRTRLLPIDGDGDVDCYGYFFLCLFSCKLWALQVLLFNSALCVVGFSFKECLVMLWVLHYCFVGLQSRRMSRRKKCFDEKFSDVEHLSTLNLSVVKCHFGWLQVGIFACVVFVLGWLLQLMGKNAFWLKTFISRWS